MVSRDSRMASLLNVFILVVVVIANNVIQSPVVQAIRRYFTKTQYAGNVA